MVIGYFLVVNLGKILLNNIIIGVNMVVEIIMLYLLIFFKFVNYYIFSKYDVIVERVIFIMLL